MSSETRHIEKEALRAEAKRKRSMLLSLSAVEQGTLCDQFFKHIPLEDSHVVAAYWPKGRELDTQVLIDHLLERNIRVALPVIQKDTKVLKFAAYDNETDLTIGLFGVCHPVVSENTEWLEPDVFVVPMLAFDRRGYRLGFGGGYYDATLEYYKKNKDIRAIGLGYAQQACLFNLPTEEHDVKMDWIITEQSAQSF